MSAPGTVEAGLKTPVPGVGSPGSFIFPTTFTAKLSPAAPSA